MLIYTTESVRNAAGPALSVRITVFRVAFQQVDSEVPRGIAVIVVYHASLVRMLSFQVLFSKMIISNCRAWLLGTEDGEHITQGSRYAPLNLLD